MFTALLQARLSLYSTDDNYCCLKTGRDNVVVLPLLIWQTNKNTWYFGAPHLPLLNFCFCFWCDSIWCTQLFWVWEQNLSQISNNDKLRQSNSLCKRINDYITNSDINSLGTLNATFPAFSHDRLNLYNTGDDQGCWKTCRFYAVVQPPLRWQKNQQTPGLLVILSYLLLIFMLFWCDAIQCMKLFWVWG